MTASNAWAFVIWQGGILLGLGTASGDYVQLTGGVFLSVVSFFAFRTFGTPSEKGRST